MKPKYNVYHVFSSSSSDPLLPCALDDAPKPPKQQQLWREESKLFKSLQTRRSGLLKKLLKLAFFLVATTATALVLAGQFYGHSRAVGADLPGLPQHLTLERLRQLGERYAARYSGTTRMGLPRGKATYSPVDWDKVRRSCAPATEAGAGRKPAVVLVTGAAGFVGMHAAVALRARGDGVLGLDNFNDYYPVSLKRARQLHAEAGGVYTADGDINDADLLRRLFEACRFTHVVHMAAQAGVRYATQNPFSYVHSNLAGQVTLLEVAKEQAAPPAVVYASSSSVYGLNRKQPFHEDDAVDTPASLYAATKRADELMAHVYHNIYGLSVTGLRFFTVYGPWGRPDMAAYKFAVSLMRGEPIPIFQGPAGSELSRDFTYIDDIVAGVLAALDTAPPSGRASGAGSYRLFNLGNTHPHTVTELVQALEVHMGLSANRKYIPLPPTGDVLATYADISRAKKELGYLPAVGLDEGIRRFADWFYNFYGTALDEGAALPADWTYKPM